VEKLRRGARVADVGCGHGASTILMAREFPDSTFVGFDYHAPSIDRARTAAQEAEVAPNCRFEVADSRKYPGTGYDLVAFFDCLSWACRARPSAGSPAARGPERN
jgi:trans-aconitate methyltransferase